MNASANRSTAVVTCRGLVVIPLIFLACVALAQSDPPRPYPDSADRSLWSSSSLGLRFTYPKTWQLGHPTQDTTQVVITWQLKKSKTLLATCYIEALDSQNGSTIASLTPTKVKSEAESIAQSLLKNMRQRAPDAELLTWREAVQDGQPTVFTIRQGTIETFDSKHRMKVYSLTTAWRKREVNFECATPVFGHEFEEFDGGKKLVDQVETSIMSVMRTLQFDRSTTR